MFYRIMFFSVFCCLLAACKEASTIESEEAESESRADSLMLIDTDTSSVQDVVVHEVYEDPEVQAAHKEIVKKYGAQWDFCACVVKNDSVNKALEQDDLSDEAFDFLFDRSEQIDSKCKSLLIQPNQTPEDRAKHEKKVKACLRNNK